MKKIQVGFLLSYDYEKLKNSIPPVYNSADAIFIAWRNHALKLYHPDLFKSGHLHPSGILTLISKISSILALRHTHVDLVTVIGGLSSRIIHWISVTLWNIILAVLRMRWHVWLRRNVPTYHYDVVTPAA